MTKERVEKCIEIGRELLETRGYSVVDLDTNKLYGVHNSRKENILFWIVDKNKFNVRCIEECINEMNAKDILHSILVYKEGITGFAKRIANACQIEIELFSINQLQYNITKHVLQPKFIRLGEQQKKEFYEKIGFNTEIPKMFKTDPISRFYNYKEGDTIKILRKNGEMTFRKVVEKPI